MKSSKRLGSTAAEAPDQFQSDTSVTRYRNACSTHIHRRNEITRN